MEELDIGITWEEDIGIDWGRSKNEGFKARYYQAEAADAIREGWDKYQTQFIEMATGCGKTVIFSGICQEHKEQGKKVLVLAHREELVDQAIDKMYKCYALVAGKEQAGSHGSLHDDVVCASIQTMQSDKRLESWAYDHFDLVIVDECHRTLAKGYLKVLNYFKEGGANILGVTATADRGDKRNLGEFYEHCSYEYNLLDACKDGFLVPPVAVQVPIKIDLSGVKKKRSANGSDLDATEIAKRISPLLDEIAAAIAQYAPNRKTLLFMPSIDTAKMMADSLCAQGLAGGYVSGECQDRHQKIADYNSGKTQYLCNAMLLIEGFDHDEIACVVVLRATEIRSLYAQAVGRGTRPLEGVINGLETAEDRIAAIKASRKPNLLILDFLWTTDKLDLVNPVDLVTGGRKEVRKAMMENGGQGDLIELQEIAEVHMLEVLEANVKKNSAKKKRVIDPLRFAVITGDAFLADWEPTEKWHSEKMTEAQKKALTKAGIDVEAVKYKGLASRIIDRIFKRQKLGLATSKQLAMLNQFGYKDGLQLTVKEATKVIDELIESKRKKRNV